MRPTPRLRRQKKVGGKTRNRTSWNIFTHGLTKAIVTERTEFEPGRPKTIHMNLVHILRGAVLFFSTSPIAVPGPRPHHANMKLLRLLLGVVCASATAELHAAGRPVSRPNVVYLLADDLGYGDIGCYKQQPSKIPTPHVDRLAAEGIRFTDAHAPTSVCSPTRYALLTGRYAWRSPLQRGVVLPWGAPIIAPERL